MQKMRAESSKSEPTTEPRTDPAMTPARWACDDDAPLIGVEADDDKTEDETEGSREGGVEAVVGGGVVRVEEEDGNVVEGVTDMDEGVTDMDEGVAEVKGGMLDSEPVG